MKMQTLRNLLGVRMAAAGALLLLFPLAGLAMPGFMGVGVGEITADKLSALKLKEERGVEILTVTPDTPAAEAGLKPHDVILEFNGARVDSAEQFQRMVREMPGGRTVKLLISRDGNTQTVAVKLSDKFRSKALLVGPRGEFSFEMPRIEIPDMDFRMASMFRTARLGIEAQTLGKQLGEYLGVPNGEGVLVVSVERDSVAEKAGLKAGDVIVKVNNEKVGDTRDLRNALREKKEKTPVPVTIIRNKRESTLNVALESRDPRRESIPSRAERF